MTRGSIQEYTEAVRERYLRASKKGKGAILDEFVNVTGYHRQSAIQLLRRKRQVVPWRRRGRARQYDVHTVEALKVAWEVTERICSRRLQPFLPELIKVLRRYGEKLMTAEVEVQLCQMCPSTIDRLLPSYRRLGGRRPFSTTKPGSLLKHSIPIRTFADWEENRPGFLEV
ncbi:MAG: transposase, partial [Dehalococcoidia bacterium]|nr:transposase [Dehalococcoidia bacterium]